MKKILAISALSRALPFTLASCGADRNNTNDDGSYYSSHDYRDNSDRDSAGDHMKDAVDGAKDAGEDIVGGAGDAANDIIDGLDGDVEKDARSTRTTTKR